MSYAKPLYFNNLIGVTGPTGNTGPTRSPNQ